MEFKSKSELARHFKQLEAEGWVTSDWLIKEYMDGDKPMTRKTKVFKINFDNVKKQ